MQEESTLTNAQPKTQVTRVTKSDMGRLGIALFGGILVLNYYLARLFFTGAIDGFAMKLSALIGAIILSLPIYWEAVKDLCHGKVGMNELVALALLAAFAREDYPIAGAVAFFMLISITIEKRTAIGAEAAIEAVVRMTPRTARRLKADGTEEEIDAIHDLNLGDICRVRPGENFPADGKIRKGNTTVNQASITGESLPADKNEGDDVFAGTLNLTGLVEFEVTRKGTDTTLGKVRNLIADAEQSKMPIQRMIDQYIGYYTPIILMISGLTWFITRDMSRVIAVLVMAVPAALVLAHPSAVIAAVSSASRLGILIKDVAQLELVAKIKAIIFDKTGTLTEGNLEVARLEPVQEGDLAQLVQVAVSVEHHSNHPTAVAIKQLAQKVGIEELVPEKYEEVAGKGVSAIVNGQQCYVGRQTWLADLGIDVSMLDKSHEATESEGMSIVSVACDGKALGWIGLHDAIREVSAEAVKELRELGVEHCCMVTGDNQKVADVVARQIGITEVYAGCLPEEKANVVHTLKQTGAIVAVVGDGVNDAPALAAGDIGMAMGAIGSDVAVQSASIALMNNDLRRIPFFIGLSRRTRLLMNQNLAIGLTFIMVGVYFAIAGALGPVGAALIHTASSLLVIFNSARLVRSGEMLNLPDGK
ncbi:MAG: cation-translocating P-type ATPase [Victivallales bacterium]|jgi:Cd2+/Zn2+-exporting ATPase|nr:cation-translocating P-type ATPase [Victivallales bacterium]